MAKNNSLGFFQRIGNFLNPTKKLSDPKNAKIEKYSGLSKQELIDLLIEKDETIEKIEYEKRALKEKLDSYVNNMIPYKDLAVGLKVDEIRGSNNTEKNTSINPENDLEGFLKNFIIEKREALEANLNKMDNSETHKDIDKLAQIYVFKSQVLGALLAATKFDENLPEKTKDSMEESILHQVDGDIYSLNEYLDYDENKRKGYADDIKVGFMNTLMRIRYDELGSPDQQLSKENLIMMYHSRIGDGKIILPEVRNSIWYHIRSNFGRLSKDLSKDIDVQSMCTPNSQSNAGKGNPTTKRANHDRINQIIEENAGYPFDSDER